KRRGQAAINPPATAYSLKPCITVAQILKIETGRFDPPCFLNVLVNSKVFVISNTSATGVRGVFRSNPCLLARHHREGIDAAPANSRLPAGDSGLITQHQHVASS